MFGPPKFLAIMYALSSQWSSSNMVVGQYTIVLIKLKLYDNVQRKTIFFIHINIQFWCTMILSETKNDA